MLTDLKTHLIGKRYQLEDVIGQGGMGSVYKAYDRLTGEYVALKRVLQAVESGKLQLDTAGADYRFALAQEFKLLATMHHPHVIEVQDYGFDHEGQPFFTMELLPSTQTIIEASQGQPLAAKVNYIVQMFHALTYLHRRGVLHRDLKPANVLVVDDDIKVLDFGLSIMADTKTPASASGYQTTAGTIAYMAPEVLMGHKPTVAADLYAAGVMMYEILTDKFPFEENGLSKLINAVIYQDPDFAPLQDYGDLALIVQRLLQKDPDSRFETAREVIDALSYVVDHPVTVTSAAMRDSFIKAARLVGRDSELDQLGDALGRAIDGEGSMWLVAGESGVGKSRLIDEIRTIALVRGALAMRGSSTNEGRSPYYLWRTVFRWVALLLDDIDPVDAGLIKMLVPDAVTLPHYDLEAASHLEPQNIKSRLFNLLQMAFVRQPIVILLEDIQWSSNESLLLLNQLIKAVESLPVMIVASYRDDERPDLPATLPPVPLIKLDRLSGQYISELSEAMLGSAGKHPQVLDLLQRETEGNIFFIVEVVRALAEEVGDLEQIGRMTLPHSIFSGGIKLIIQRRLDKVPEEWHYLLQIAAIIGREQDMALLRRIAPDEELDDFLVICANAAVLEQQDGNWQFTHDKLREGVIERLSPVERRDLHREVAEAIEALYDDERYAASLAHHWGQAGQHRREARYASIAGDQALQSGAYQKAIDYFERALQLTTSNPVNPQESQMQRVRLQHRKAEAYLGFGGYTQARQLYHESLMLSEQLNNPKGTADSLYGLGSVEYARVLFESADVFFKRSLNIYRRLDDRDGEARTLNSLGNVAYEMGDDEQAKTLYQQSLDIARSIGMTWGLAGALQQPQADTSQKSLLDQRQRLMRQLTTEVEKNDQRSMAVTYRDLGRVAIKQEKPKEAHNYFQSALEIHQKMSDTAGLIRILREIAMLAQKTDEQTHAQGALMRAVNAAQADDTLRLIALLGWARYQHAQGQHGLALMTLAFILNAPGLDTPTEDEAEELIYEIEQVLDTEDLENHWEQGKASTLDALLTKLQA